MRFEQLATNHLMPFASECRDVFAIIWPCPLTRQQFGDRRSTVTLYLPEPLRTYAGGITELPIAARTVRDMLEGLEQTQAVLYRNVCDETGAVRRHLNIFVNADNIRDRDGLDTGLNAGDVVTIVPAVSGG
jgi:molybdopterin synthase sulfur carrier subunit